MRDGLGGKGETSREQAMAIAETTYLYALAGLSVSFVGFSTLVIVFRQSAGGRLSSYDSYFVLSFMQAGFIVTAGALLPPLFALYGLPEATVLRVASAIMAMPIAWFVASVPGRRRAATGTAAPGFIRLFLLLQLCAAVALALGALGRPLGPGVAPYASALTLILVTSGLAFLLALHKVMLPQLPKGP
jgi:hypothetical protein